MSEEPKSISTVPLCVDLDGTFIRGDMMWDAVLRLLRSNPLLLLRVPLWLSSGRQILKSKLTQHAPPPLLAPPINQRLLTFLLEEKSKGRSIILATASHRSALEPILQAFPFDDVLASDDTINLKGSAKAKALVERYGEKGFDYAGDSTADEAIWQVARKAIIVQRSRRLVQRWNAMFDVEKVIPTGDRTTWKDWAKALRVHQWSKNLLIAVPFLVGHHYNEPWQLAGLIAAFLAMGICASGTYLWNDLLDMDHDRSHITKKDRLAASGRTSVQRLISTSLLLVIAGLCGAFYLKWQLGLLLCGYIITTLAYSLVLKRIAIADIFILAFLYVSRIMAGILISQAIVSFWLFSFTFLFFLSLAAMKRFVELRRTTAPGNQSMLAGRGYQQEDLSMVSEFGISTGIASIVVLGLYSNSTQVTALYQNPEWFWGVCVAALYWITRIWFLTKRGVMHDDPVIFAIKDRGTWLIAAFALACVILASPI
jgi:4-hydroxybenzoate polyprenyltransferase/phosphoserine phosphatase